MSHIETLNKKIVLQKDLAELISSWKKQGMKIVFSNGCFDILHLGHIDYLSKAADLGNRLIIGLNSDASVKRIKGEKRPINNEKSRSGLLAGLFFVDAVVLFNEDTPLQLIELIVPDVLVKGSDYEKTDIVGAEIVLANKGKVETIPFLEGYSTSAIEEKIIFNAKKN